MPAIARRCRRAIDAAIALDPTQFDEIALKAHAITEAASVVAAIPEVRQALMNYQREFATKPPGAVLDGRDIGTVIAPGADVKIFVVATPEVRAAPPVPRTARRGASLPTKTRFWPTCCGATSAIRGGAPPRSRPRPTLTCSIPRIWV